jgi:hypothetical protein
MSENGKERISYEKNLEYESTFMKNVKFSVYPIFTKG